MFDLLQYDCAVHAMDTIIEKLLRIERAMANARDLREGSGSRLDLAGFAVRDIIKPRAAGSGVCCAGN